MDNLLRVNDFRNGKLKIGDVVFRNPVVTASGTFGTGEELNDVLDYSLIGGITTKTITVSPRKGNPQPRLLETSCGLLNSIGLENKGFEAVYKDLLERDPYQGFETNVIFSIAGDKIEDFVYMSRLLNNIEDIAVLELNLSCPNVHSNGKNFDSETSVVRKIIRGVKKVAKKPITVKLSPVQDFIANAVMCEKEGADAVTLGNTFWGTAIDTAKKRFVFANIVAGYSGPAVKPMALYNIYRARNKIKIPIIASGGISTLNDALEFIMGGSDFVSIGTMNFVDYETVIRIAKGLEDYIGK